jgi:uncharacterized membrane protein required for colicin V production
MVELSFLLWVLVVIFGIIGAMRGWGKEVLVTFSVILSIFLTTILEKFAPAFQKTLGLDGDIGLFWLRILITIGLVVFGYHSVSIPRINASPRLVRNTVQDALLGALVGAVNGFLIFGSLWYYLHQADYPVAAISAPENMDVTLKLMKVFAPAWLGAPAIYFAIAIAFAFVIVVIL